jgi:phosphonate transport system substrate-binding protein
MVSRRLFLLQVFLLLAACQNRKTQQLGRLTIGVVSYGEGERSIEQYSELDTYLETQLKTIIDLEPAFNEVRALEQIKRKNWSLVFAPPGLAAPAIWEQQYSPIFPLEGVEKTTALIVVREESPIKKLDDLADKAIALGQLGSAASYYLPLYNLYGLKLAEIRMAPTPKTILEWLHQKEVAAGALSLDDLERYQPAFKDMPLRVIYSDSVPPGSIIVSPTVERYHQEYLRTLLASASPRMIASAGYIPNAEAPNYRRLMEIIATVRPISGKIQEKPVFLKK